MIRRDTHARVIYLNLYSLAASGMVPDRHRQAMGAIGHGLHGIDRIVDQVDHNLKDLMPVTHRSRQLRIFAHDSDAGLFQAVPINGQSLFENIRQLNLFQKDLGLCVALFLIGAGLSKSSLRAVGPRPLVFGVLLWLIVASATLAAANSSFAVF